MTIVIGIDPGLSGAIAYLDECTGAASVVDMPTCEGRNSASVEVDWERLYDHLTTYAKGNARIIAIEEVWGRPGQGGKSSFVFGMAYGTLISACRASHVRYVRVIPQTWQTSVLGKFDAGDSKKASVAWAEAKYGRKTLIRGKGRAPDHNRADALAIANWVSKSYPEGVDVLTKDRTRKGGK